MPGCTAPRTAAATGFARAIKELGSNHLLGGQRDPNNYYDFFDVTGDKVVDLSDTLDVLSYFGDPALPNTPADLRDRAMLDTGHPWQLSDADDGLDLTDALNNLASFGDDCSGLP